MNDIIEIINSTKSNQPNVNPTEIYNEGWMTRLLVHHSIDANLIFKGIEFGKLANWTSEALISSPFVKAEKNREGYTHADMALGDFSVKYEDGGKINVSPSATTFGIIEAKMRSPLSQGTTHAPNYNQASRNVACIAENASEKCNTFFYVVAPKSQIFKVHKNGLSTHDMVKSKIIVKQIAERFELHNTQNEPNNKESEILSRGAKCKIGTITYEEWIEAFTDKSVHESLSEFYLMCKKWNKIKDQTT